MAQSPIDVVHEDENGRILTADSMAFFDERVSTKDIIVCGSYGADSSLRWVHQTGAKGAITHECGIGKDNAGIGALAAAQEEGIPMVACETMSARLADGSSVCETGKVGQVNQIAIDLGVRPGQTIAEAARLMLKAPDGKIIETNNMEDEKTITLLDETQDGTIYASWGLPVLKKLQEPHPTSVFVRALIAAKRFPCRLSAFNYGALSPMMPEEGWTTREFPPLDR
jgi:phosphohistidine swiveling domain-containing protein